MKSGSDDDLALLFAMREAPDAPPFLAERIIARARGLPQRRGFFATLGAMLTVDLGMPAPAFVMASLLMLGFLAILPLSNQVEKRMLPEPVAVSDVPATFYDEAAL